MPKTANSYKARSLDIAEKVLMSLNPPKAIKYHVLATLIQTEGWGYAGKQEGKAVLYEALKHAIANGDTRFTMHKRGFVSLTEHKIKENELPEYAVVKRTGRRKKQEIIKEKYGTDIHLNKTCGECHYIKYNGIKEITRESGICMNDQSNKCSVRSNANACPLFFQRSERQIKVDETNSETMKKAINKISFSGIGGRKRSKING